MPINISEIKSKNGVIYLYLRWTENGKRKVQKTGVSLRKSMLKRDKERIMLIADQMRIDKEKELERKQLGRYLPAGELGAEDFLTYLSKLAKEKDMSHWNNTLAHIRAFIGNETPSISDITSQWCIEFQKYLQNQSKKNGKPLQPSTISKYLDVLSACFIRAIDNGLVIRNPLHNDSFRSKKIKVPEKPVNFLQVEDVRKLIRTVVPNTTKDIREAFIFSVLTGLRISDIESLTFENVEGSAIHITMVKTSTTVYIPLVEASQLIIDHQRSKYPEAQSNVQLFRIGYKNVINKPIEKWGKEAGLKQHFSFHSARRTCATLLFNNAKSEERTVKSILGHKTSSKDVFAKYASVNDDLKREALQVLSDLFIEDLHLAFGDALSQS